MCEAHGALIFQSPSRGRNPRVSEREREREGERERERESERERERERAKVLPKISLKYECLLRSREREKRGEEGEADWELRFLLMYGCIIDQCSGTKVGVGTLYCGLAFLRLQKIWVLCMNDEHSAGEFFSPWLNVVAILFFGTPVSECYADK